MSGQAKWKKFSKEELEQFVKTSTSYAQVAIKCGYAANAKGYPKGGSYLASMKNMIELYDFNTDHFFEANGISHNKGNFNYDRFRRGNKIKSANALEAIAHLRGRKCESCGLESWLNKPIILEVHHIDGDNDNNELSNLQLLCPNCHSQTPNWRGKNVGVKKKSLIPESKYVEALKESSSIFEALKKLGLSGGGNYKRAQKLVEKYQIIHLLEP